MVGPPWMTSHMGVAGRVERVVRRVGWPGVMRVEGVHVAVVRRGGRAARGVVVVEGVIVGRDGRG